MNCAFATASSVLFGQSRACTVAIHIARNCRLGAAGSVTQPPLPDAAAAAVAGAAGAVATAAWAGSTVKLARTASAVSVARPAGAVSVVRPAGAVRKFPDLRNGIRISTRFDATFSPPAAVRTDPGHV